MSTLGDSTERNQFDEIGNKKINRENVKTNPTYRLMEFPSSCFEVAYFVNPRNCASHKGDIKMPEKIMENQKMVCFIIEETDLQRMAKIRLDNSSLVST